MEVMLSDQVAAAFVWAFGLLVVVYVVRSIV